MRRLRAAERARIAEECQRILGVNPTMVSRARVKRLRGGVFPPYRLRVDDFRVFYDVDHALLVVMVYGVVTKAEATQWLAQSGQQEETR